MSKRDSLKFTIKRSLVVGTTAATLVSGCGACVTNATPRREEDYEDSGTSVVDGGDTAADEDDEEGTETGTAPDGS